MVGDDACLNIPREKARDRDRYRGRSREQEEEKRCLFKGGVSN